MDDIEFVLHESYLKFANSLIDKVLNASAAEIDDPSPGLFEELKQSWIEEFSRIVDLKNHHESVKNYATSAYVRQTSTNQALSMTIRSPLILAPLPKLNLHLSPYNRPKRTLHNSGKFCASFEEAAMNDGRRFVDEQNVETKKRRRLGPSDIVYDDIPSTFDIIIGLAVYVDFDGDVVQLQDSPILSYIGRQKGRIVAIEKWGGREYLKKICIRFSKGDELITHWPNRNISPYLPGDNPRPIRNTDQMTTESYTANFDNFDKSNIEDNDVFEPSSFDDLLSGDAHDWIANFNDPNDGIDDASVANEVTKLTNGSSGGNHGSADVALIATGERIGVDQLQEMELYFSRLQGRKPKFIAENTASISFTTSNEEMEGLNLHPEDDPDIPVAEPDLLLIGKAKRFVKGARSMQLTLHDVYLRDQSQAQRDFLLSDVKFQIDTEHLFG